MTTTTELKKLLFSMILKTPIWLVHLASDQSSVMSIPTGIELFDTVPHARLISKLKAYGMEGPLIRWITNFLSKRIQRVVVNNEMSTWSWSTISSGIPQGSVLGPTFFVVFINDIPDSINSIVNIFADDTKLFRSVTSKEEHVVLQSDLDMLAD